jgi:Ca2+-transporting ATPase
MLTGDSLITAEAISEMIGLQGNSIEEHELRRLSDNEFNDVVRDYVIFARITPETKLRIIRCLKNQDEIVAVTGDGINDILALKEAHIGVSMGIRGSDVAREVSDIILLDDNFASVVKAVREGRRVYSNMKKSIKAHIAANVDEMFVVLFALLLAWPLPLMPLAILWMNLITDSLPSLSLAFEPEDKDIMRKKPISKKETILTGLMGFLFIAGIISFIITLGFFALNYETNLEKARTIALTAAIFCEMFIVLSCRSERNIWEIGWFSNKFLVYSILIAIGLQLLAIYTPLALVFGFVPLSFMEVLMILGASCTIFVFFEVWKFYKSKNDSI